MTLIGERMEAILKNLDMSRDEFNALSEKSKDRLSKLAIADLKRKKQWPTEKGN